MRISKQEGDPGHTALAYGDVDVFLDGQKQLYAVTADDVEGLVVRFKTDQNGSIIDDGSGEPILERVTGYVKIVFND